MTQTPSDPQYDKLQDTLIEVIGQPMCNTRQLLSKPRQPTDKLTLQCVVSQHVLTLWVHQQRLIEPFLNHMLTVQQGILQGENFAPTSRQHQLAHQLWLNMVAVSAFHTAIQHMSYRADLPWAWQEPDLTHHFFEQCHAVDSRALFDIAHRLLGVSKR